MSLFGREKDGRERAHDVPPAFGTPMDAVRPREVAMGERDRSIGQTGGIDAFLGKGTSIAGKLVFEGPGRIEGKVEGEIAAHDTLTVGEGAVVNAKITGTSIVVEGQVTGDIVARQRLELRPSGRVRGNISAPCLVVHEGAILDGQCAMSGADTKALTTTSDDGIADLILDRARESAQQVSSTFDR